MDSDLLTKRLRLITLDASISIRRITPAAIFLALLYTTYIADFSPLYFAHINITATGERTKSTASAAVVWLRSPSYSELATHRYKVQKSIGWKENNHFLASVRNQPAELEIQSWFSANQRLEFFETPFSGNAWIEIEGKVQSIDLFQGTAGTLILNPNHFHSGSQLMMIYMVTRIFLRGFVVAIFYLLLLQPLYEFIPNPAAVHSTIVPENSRWKEFILIIIFLFVVGIFLIAFYPGVMTVDSYEAYYEAVTHHYIDWHPPILSALWSLTNKILEGAGGMFLLNVFAVATSAYLLSKIALKKQKAFFFLPMLAILLPFVTCILFVHWSDVSLAVVFLLSFCLWYYWRSNGKMTKSKLMILLCLLFYASNVRHNALPAAVPLIFIVLYDFAPKFRAFVLSIVIAIIFYGGNYILSYPVLKTTHSYTIQAILCHDLMGIYSITHKNYVPESYLPRSRLNSLMMHFDHTNLDPTTWMNNTYVTRDSSKISHLRRNWIEAVLENPAAYFTHRWLAFRSFLTVIASTNLPVSEPEPDFLSEKKPPLMSETKLGRIHTKYVEWASQYLFFGFQAVTYLLGSAALLLISIWKKRMILAALSCSAFLYIAPYFFVAPAPNYRYVYWAVFAVLLSVFVWWIEKLRVQPIRFS